MSYKTAAGKQWPHVTEAEMGITCLQVTDRSQNLAEKTSELERTSLPTPRSWKSALQELCKNNWVPKS